NLVTISDMILFFFFSSRRRHTRSKRDWSSDVCSSDLVSGEKTWNEVDDRYRPDTVEVQLFANKEEADTVYLSKDTDWEYEFADRSEERRVGKECRSWGAREC